MSAPKPLDVLCDLVPEPASMSERACLAFHLYTRAEDMRTMATRFHAKGQHNNGKAANRIAAKHLDVAVAHVQVIRASSDAKSAAIAEALEAKLVAARGVSA